MPKKIIIINHSLSTNEEDEKRRREKEGSDVSKNLKLLSISKLLK